MAVKIRMKKMGRKHRPFFRVCAMDVRSPRDGRVIEELGTYDPMVPETDARAILKGARIDYWIVVGAQPTPKVAVLIKKYGTEGSHLQKQADAIERLGGRRAKAIEEARQLAANTPKPKVEEAPAPAAEGEAAAEAGDAAAPAEEAKAEEAAAPEAKAEAEAKKEAPAEAKAEEAKKEEAPAEEAKKEAE